MSPDAQVIFLKIAAELFGLAAERLEAGDPEAALKLAEAARRAEEQAQAAGDEKETEHG